jgi:hypothetical protein
MPYSPCLPAHLLTIKDIFKNWTNDLPFVKWEIFSLSHISYIVDFHNSGTDLCLVFKLAIYLLFKKQKQGDRG